MPTENDLNSFQYIDNKTRAKILYLYSIQGYNMKDIADIMGYEDPRSVSLITRCYGFDRCRAGMFTSIGATEKDVMAFVKEYPDGCPDEGNAESMRDFLKDIVASRMGLQRRQEAMGKNQNNKFGSQRNVGRFDDDDNQGFFADDDDDPGYAVAPRRQGNSFVDNPFGGGDFGGNFVDKLSAFARSLFAGNGAGGVRDKKKDWIIVGIVAAVVLYIFRKPIMSFLLSLLPIVIVGALIVLFIKWLLGGGAASLGNMNRGGGRKRAVRKSGRGAHLEPSVGGIIMCIIMMYIGIGGINNGGHLLVGAIFCLIGLAFIVKFD